MSTQNMEDPKKTPSIPPTSILDIDTGIDFTFEGLGLKGNRKTKEDHLEICPKCEKRTKTAK